MEEFRVMICVSPGMDKIFGSYGTNTAHYTFLPILCPSGGLLKFAGFEKFAGLKIQFYAKDPPLMKKRNQKKNSNH